MFEDVFRVNYKVVKKALVIDGVIQNDIKVDLSEFILTLEADIREDYVKFKDMDIRAWTTPKGYCMMIDIHGMSLFNPCFLRLMDRHEFKFVGFVNGFICFMKDIKVD